MSFGIQKVGDPSTFMSWSHWTREDAQQAAEYNSARWGEWEVWADGVVIPVPTPDTLRGVPKTTLRNFRMDDDEYAAAKAAAEFNGESVSDVIRRSLIAYTKRTDKKRGQGSR